ncbi:MAG: SDR family NAD(P)-dependent oxidoreductase [Alphaproteobacteria bacterium]
MVNSVGGKVAIVTGAGRGIGEAIARVFAREGAKLLVADLDGAAAEASAARIAAAGGEAAPVAADVTDWGSVQAMAEAAVRRYGRIDVLCSNAGIYPESSIEAMSLEQWNKVQVINVNGAFLTVKACLPQMKKQGGGRVVITSSITGNRTAMPNMSHYATSKGAVNGFIRGAAFELAKYNITVNGVEPGMIDTEGLRAAMGPALIAELVKIMPIGRFGSVEDVAYAMAFLASDEAQFITGQTIVVDGGQTLAEVQSMVEPPVRLE